MSYKNDEQAVQKERTELIDAGLLNEFLDVLIQYANKIDLSKPSSLVNSWSTDFAATKTIFEDEVFHFFLPLMDIKIRVRSDIKHYDFSTNGKESKNLVSHFSINQMDSISLIYNDKVIVSLFPKTNHLANPKIEYRNKLGELTQILVQKIIVEQETAKIQKRIMDHVRAAKDVK